jgi:HEAT repeat protein
MMRTVLAGLTVASLSLSLLSGCEPALDNGHPLAIAQSAIDDVTYWNSIINTDAHRASVKIMAAIPDIIATLPSKVERKKGDEEDAKKRLVLDKTPLSQDKVELLAQRWSAYDVAFAELKGKTKSTALAALIGAYKNPDSRDLIVDGIIRFGKDRTEAGSNLLVAAVSDVNEAPMAQPAAAALLEGCLPEKTVKCQLTDSMSRALIPVIGNTAAPTENRYAALRIVARQPVKEAIPSLIKVVTGNPDIQPIALTELAAEALGELKAAAAVDGLIACLWLNDHMGRNAVKACRIALNKIGRDAAIAKVIATLERKNAIVEKRAKDNHYDFGGVIEFKSAEMLGDMPAAAAVDPLIKAFSTWEEMPKAVIGHPTREPHFQKTRIQRVISLATSLAIIGDERAIEPLLAMALSKRSVEVMNASIHQLAFLGKPKAIPEMMKILEEKTDINEFATQAFHYQVALAVARILDPADSRTLRAVEGQLKKTNEQIKAWRLETKAAMEKELDPVKRAGMEPNFLHFGNMLRLYAEVDGTVARVKSCKYKPTCWAKELPTRATADDFRRAYRTARAVIDATKACGNKLSCWKDYMPTRGETDAFIKVYKDTLAKVNGMERAVAGELQKEYSGKAFITSTAELCKADKACWNTLLPSATDVAKYAQNYETVQKRIGSVAKTETLKRDRYENAEFMVNQIERCTSSYDSCRAKAGACKEGEEVCRKMVQDCGSAAVCFAKELGDQKNVKPVMDTYTALEIKIEDTAIVGQMSRTQKRAMQILETANACKEDGKCWSGKFSTVAEVEPLLKVYDSAQKKMAEKKGKDGKPLPINKMKKAVEKHVKRNHEEGKLIIATGDKCKSDVKCWQTALGDETRIKTFRDAYADAKKVSKQRAVVAKLSQTYRDAQLVAKAGSVCTGDKSPMICWSKQLGSTSRANSLIKAYKTATVKTEDQAVVRALGPNYPKDAFFVVKTGKDCKDKGDCWNNRVAYRQQGWRMLAAYRLGQAKRKATARDELIPYLGDGDLIFRNIVLFALRKVAQKGDQAAIKGLKAAKKADEDRVNKKQGKYKGSITALELAISQFE